MQGASFEDVFDDGALPLAEDLRQATAAWLAHLTHERGATANTLDAYERDLRQFLAWLKGDAIREFLRQQATVSGSDLLGRIQALAVKEMNTELARGVRLSTTIDRSEPAGMRVRAAGNDVGRYLRITPRRINREPLPRRCRQQEGA